MLAPLRTEGHLVLTILIERSLRRMRPTVLSLDACCIHLGRNGRLDRRVKLGITDSQRSSSSSSSKSVSMIRAEGHFPHTTSDHSSSPSSCPPYSPHRTLLIPSINATDILFQSGMQHSAQGLQPPTRITFPSSIRNRNHTISAAALPNFRHNYQHYQGYQS